MDERARAWSIVALGLLVALLSYVLLRTPPKVTSSSARSRSHPAPSAPAPKHPTEPEFNPDMYRGWPLFFGWPLPEVPEVSGSSDQQGTGGSKAPDTSEHRVTQ